MAYRILLRRDSSTNWGSQNPVLLDGEPGYETDTGKLKIGNGTATWSTLGYYQGATGATGAGSTGPNTFYGSQTISGGTSGTLILLGATSLNFPDDPSAATGGVPLYGIYHDNGALKIRLV